MLGRGGKGPSVDAATCTEYNGSLLFKGPVAHGPAFSQLQAISGGSLLTLLDTCVDG
jgi:hypothetical protein